MQSQLSSPFPARGLAAALLAVALAHTTFAADAECRWAATPPVIDGVLAEAAWKNAQVIEGFTKGWEVEGSRTPKTRTKARLLWDREYLYFAAEMEDTDVFANVTEQDGSIWLCDVFELFFKPAKDKPGYFEFEINAANAKLDMFMPSRGSGGFARHGKERDFHMESAVKVNGTLNLWNDKDKGWTVEGRIPWRDFLPAGGRPVPGEVWQHALCRYDYSAGFEHPDLSSTAPLARPDFHRHEDYLPLRFIGPDAGKVPARVAWDVSRLIGSPEPPLPFRAVPAFPKLAAKKPLAIVNEPGRNSLLLIELIDRVGYSPERDSRICRVANDPGVTTPEVLLELDESAFDICFHPQFARNGHVFIGANGRFGKGKDDFNNRVLRYTMDRTTGRIAPASRQVILEWQSNGHNGAALAFGKDGMLYVTSGDGSSDSDTWDSGQDLTRLLAKLLRIDVDHPAKGKLYGIPSDNPFLNVEGARPETWAYGFRNPWRMTVDRETGDIWVGENGQDLWEYARIVRRGENYGWPVVEGSHDFHPLRKRGPTPISKPLIEHPHTDFRSLTGGVVYRGAKFAGLAGAYIYGDHSTGQIWAAVQKDGKLIRNERIAQIPTGITGFCETPQGDVLVVDYLGQSIYKLERVPPSAPPPPFPARLSETGLFTDVAALKPHPALIHYDINAPAWHDGASGDRFIALPGTERIEFRDQVAWGFPDGTALVQTLSLEEKRIETRVLLRQQGEWNGYSYVWDDAQTDAVRASYEGTTKTLASGRLWRVPGRQECMFCHSRAADFVLGLSTVQLNRPGEENENQIARWERIGLLKFDHAATAEGQWRSEFGRKKLSEAAIQAAMETLLPTEVQRQSAKAGSLLPIAPGAMKRIANPHDERAPLADRARAYLHANCSHCHAPAGGGNSPMQLASNISEAGMAIIDAEPTHATFGIPDAKVVAPGSPGNSLVIYRTATRGPGQMPPVGTMVGDADGVALLAKWIADMSPKAKGGEPTVKPR